MKAHLVCPLIDFDQVVNPISVIAGSISNRSWKWNSMWVHWS